MPPVFAALAAARAPNRRDRLSRAVVSLVGIALVLSAALLAGAQRAWADEPFRLDQQITDHVDALAGRESEVSAAISTLEERDGVDLWIAYVGSFEGMNARDWADETARRSSLGLNDILLAVATEDRAYAYSVDQEFPLSDAQLADVATGTIEPSLSDEDWAGAAIGAANAIDRSLRAETSTGPEVQPEEPSSGGGISWLPWVLGAVLILGGLVLLVSVRRGRPVGKARPAADSARDRYERMSSKELRRLAAAQLVETDDAIKTSEQDLAFAVAEFGEDQTAPFSAALQTARDDMAVAFRVQQRLDDAEPEDEATRRSLLIEICRRTDAASDRLDAEAAKFDELRDLEKNVPQLLPRLEQELATLSRRIPASAATLSELGRTYSPAAIAPVSENVAQAKQRLDFARDRLHAGNAQLQAHNPGVAVVSSRAAEEAAGQAARMLDAIDRLKQDLAQSNAKIRAAIGETERALVEASSAGNDQRLAPLVASAQTALEDARRAASDEGGRDPLGALHRLEQADDALDRALEGVRDERDRKQKARASLDRALPAARAEIDAAHDFITTRRGAVGAEARTRLSEAGRHLDRAVSLADTDPVAALREATTAESLGRRAHELAQDDVSRYRRPPGWGSGSDWGAVLGGILIGSMLGGGGHGGGGGWGVPGGFGGGRRGGGGRFGVGSFGGRGMGGRRGGGGRF